MAVDRVKLLALRQTVGVYGNVDPGQFFYATEDAAKELIKMGCAKLVDIPLPAEEKIAPTYANKAMPQPGNKEVRGPRQSQEEPKGVARFEEGPKPRPPAKEESFTITPSTSPRI